MLCKICVDMLQGSGQVWSGTLDPVYEPHKATKTLLKSAKAGCMICMALVDVAKRYMELRKDQAISIRAYLKELKIKLQEGAKFILDFEIQDAHKATFVLKESIPNQRMRPIKSVNTAASDVLDIAQSWIKKCQCARAWDEPGVKWYPKRLLDLESLRRATSKLHKTKIRLVESSDFGRQDMQRQLQRSGGGNRFVTLSHCWGKPKNGQEPLKLTSLTRKEFMTEGIELGRMPKTFQDALYFASRLAGVRFIWIDSLCIRQPLRGPSYDPVEQGSDWVEQSRYMDQVYLKAYLNISATASTDGSGGLFFERDPKLLQENEVNVRSPADSTKLTRCSVFNVSTWTDLVDHAPINRRGWVVQERILAPRVLHFCRDQIAWECSERIHAESLPSDIIMLKDLGNRLAVHGPTKDLRLSAGLQHRNTRLRGFLDPDLGMPDLYVFESWKQVVETYSQTQLTYSSDKLVALAGIAAHFRKHLFSRENRTMYIAGMWTDHLESQLLWQVNEVYRKDLVDFQNPSRRNESRAPSFSWACIDTLYGITYADVTDYGAARMMNKKRGRFDDGEDSDPSKELFFKILDSNIGLVDTQNPFGMITGAQLLVKPRFLRQVQLYKLPKERRVPCAWRLKEGSMSKKSPEHTNIYLDAPESDSEIFRDSSELYCMAGAYGERTVRAGSRYLFCLLLKLENVVLFGPNRRRYRGFKRVGITKLSHTMDSRGQEALKSVESDEVICLL